MNSTDSQAANTQPFRSKYKLHGVLTSVALIWVDFAVIYRGLVAQDPVLVGGGMIVMIAAVAVGYYFG